MKFHFAAFVLLSSILGSPAPAAEQTNAFPAELKIITRQDWGANPPLTEMKRHTLKFITIHHTGVRQQPKKTAIEKLRGLQNFSQREETLAMKVDEARRQITAPAA